MGIRLPLAAAAVLTLFVSGPARAAVEWQTWKPIEPADLSSMSPKIDPAADAEALFWHVWVEDEVQGGRDPQTVLRHYLRVKVYTERGVESQGQVDLTYANKSLVREVDARTIHRDGSIVELGKNDVFERTIVKAGGVKVKSTSFALPSVTVGSVIEYRWKEVRLRQLANYVRMDLQRTIPAREVVYHVKPFRDPDFPYGMRLQFFNMRSGLAQVKEEREGFMRVAVEDIPAFREEPRMPPAAQVRPWMLAYYSEDKKLVEEKYWKESGQQTFRAYRSLIAPDAAVKLTAGLEIGAEKDPERRLERLYDYCRTKIKRLDDDASGLTLRERDKLRNSSSPGDTIKRGTGTSQDVDVLFAALAAAAGFEVRIGALSDRGDIFWDRSFLDDYFMDERVVAVKVGEGWRFFDPSRTYVPFGMLHWRQEGVLGLVSDDRSPTFVQTQMSAPSQSLAKRTGSFTLGEDGTLEGEVRVQYTGHLAVEFKERYDAQSAEEREKALREQVKEQLGAAELSEVALENVTDPSQPFVTVYKVKVPGYAQRTGKRLFFQPAYFQRGRRPVFPASQRLHPVYFEYPWAEEDDVKIQLPAGFSLESPDAPGPITVGDLSEYKVRMTVLDGRLQLRRAFHFGGGSRVLFPADVYTVLKGYFDDIQKSDEHALTLRPVGP